LSGQTVDFTAGVIRARATNTKTERAREIPISERAREALSELQAEAPPGYLGRIFPYTEVGNSFTGACKDAGITELTFHDLRHVGISRRVAAGQPYPQIMGVSGHSEFKTFARYVNPNQETHRQDSETYSAYVRAQLARLELEKQQEVADHESEAVN
jgi:integrase